MAPLFDASEAFLSGVKMMSSPATVIQAVPDKIWSSRQAEGSRNTSPLWRVKR